MNNLATISQTQSHSTHCQFIQGWNTLTQCMPKLTIHLYETHSKISQRKDLVAPYGFSMSSQEGDDMGNHKCCKLDRQQNFMNVTRLSKVSSIYILQDLQTTDKYSCEIFLCFGGTYFRMRNYNTRLYCTYVINSLSGQLSRWKVKIKLQFLDFSDGKINLVKSWQKLVVILIEVFKKCGSTYFKVFFYEVQIFKMTSSLFL